MLTCAQFKELKIELKNKFYIKKITFETFKTLNAQFSRKTSTFSFLTCASKAQVNISLIIIIMIIIRTTTTPLQYK